MPDWVKKFNTKGFTVRFQNGNYRLIKVTSIRIANLKYPKLIQDFVGIITPEGLQPKKVLPNTSASLQLEYGLSSFLLLNFRNDLIKLYYSETLELRNFIVLVTIISYMFGDFDKRYLPLTHLSKQINQDYLDLLNERRLKLVERGVNKINELLNIKIPNKEDLNYLLFSLRNIVISNKSDLTYLEQTIKILEEYQLKYEKKN